MSARFLIASLFPILLLGCEQASESSAPTNTGATAPLALEASVSGDVLVVKNVGDTDWRDAKLLLESVPRARWQEVAASQSQVYEGFLPLIKAGKVLRISLSAFQADGTAFSSGFAMPTGLRVEAGTAAGPAIGKVVFSTGQQGRFRARRVDAPASDLSAEQQAKIRKLEAIGYAAGSTPVEEATGVLHYVPEQVEPGINLYVSGHAPGATLIDAEGNVLHTWSRDFWEIWPDYPIARETVNAQFWRRAWLLEDGAILGIFEGLGIVKLDRDSNVIWARSNKAHHDLQVLEDGRIVTLTRVAKVIPRIHASDPVLTDFISVLGPDGEELQRVPLLEAIEKSEYNVTWAEDGPAWSRDLLHTNTIHVLGPGLEATAPAFQAGRVLTSFLSIDSIAVVDLEEEKVVWMKQGVFARQHDPRIVAGGNLLLFDNQGKGEWSRVLEYQLPDMQIAWRYVGSPERPFYSQTCGSAARLANGNTLITESDNGRAIEVTPDKQIVWEFVNPHAAGDNGEFVATLFDVVRLPANAFRK